jgi:hypothetical protein
MQKIYTVTIDGRKWKESMNIDFDLQAYEHQGRFDGKYIFETTAEKKELNKEEVGMRELIPSLKEGEHFGVLLFCVQISESEEIIFAFRKAQIVYITFFFNKISSILATRICNLATSYFSGQIFCLNSLSI